MNNAGATPASPPRSPWLGYYTFRLLSETKRAEKLYVIMLRRSSRSERVPAKPDVGDAVKVGSDWISRIFCIIEGQTSMRVTRGTAAYGHSLLPRSHQCVTDLLGCGWESLMKSVTLGNVTMSHRTREARRNALRLSPLNYDRDIQVADSIISLISDFPNVGNKQHAILLVDSQVLTVRGSKILVHSQILSPSALSLGIAKSFAPARRVIHFSEYLWLSLSLAEQRDSSSISVRYQYREQKRDRHQERHGRHSRTLRQNAKSKYIDHIRLQRASEEQFRDVPIPWRSCSVRDCREGEKIEASSRPTTTSVYLRLRGLKLWMM
ncbi:hypothetical protein EVAR_40409_1 [Eumeta japonica]|uniref:Uncharacterized protein n=1 Tax=Eumeta variegata TaxID=151549 RepID=A0A4C1WCZ0_EUMVA|nr:hypothetical protein EVAR_40409_1 [Eumeta japonica]